MHRQVNPNEPTSINKAKFRDAGSESLSLSAAISHLRSRHEYWPVPLRNHVPPAAISSSAPAPIVPPVQTLASGAADEVLLPPETDHYADPGPGDASAETSDPSVAVSPSGRTLDGIPTMIRISGRRGAAEYVNGVYLLVQRADITGRPSYKHQTVKLRYPGEQQQKTMHLCVFC